MRKGISVAGVMASVMASILVASGSQYDNANQLWLTSEVWVEQARGNMLHNASPLEDGKPVKTSPENSSNSSAGGNSPTVPTTCNQQNASSPACYSATQQTRPSK